MSGGASPREGSSSSAPPPPRLLQRPVRGPPKPQRSPPLLYLDLASLASYFFPDDVAWGLALRAARGRVARFVAAARKSGTALVCFLEAGGSPEEDAAAAARPPGLLTLLTELLREEGCEVRLVGEEASADDTLAAYAQVDGASVLSGGSPRFFRYRGARYNYFGAVDEPAIEAGGELLLLHKEPPRGELPSPRGLLQPPLAYWADAATQPPGAAFARRAWHGGTPSPLLRQLPSPHARAQRLRRALYALLAEGGAAAGARRNVEESWLEWDEAAGGARVHCELAAPLGPGDSELGEGAQARALLLGSPAAAFEAVFAAEAAGAPAPPEASPEDWQNHVTGCKALVAELCAAATARPLASVLEEMGV